MAAGAARRSSPALALALVCAVCFVGLFATQVFIYLWRDGYRPPFAPTLGEAELATLTRDVVLMHHKRLPELNATLHSLARVAGAPRLRVLIAQALDVADAPAALATGALISSLELPFASLTHRPLVRSPEAASYSTDAARYGTKRGSCRNLMHGLDAVFNAAPQRTGALVVEDDARLAPDLLDFFDLAASVAAPVAASVAAPVATSTFEPSTAAALPTSSPVARVVLATSFCYPRDSHEDYASTKFLPGRLLAGQQDRYRLSPLRSLTFRTLAWLVTREVYAAMRHDFVTGPTPMLALPDGAPLHPSLRGCAYCENLCYDHWLEWRWRNALVVCPAKPRAEARFSGGMTEHKDILRAGGDEGHHARQRAGTGQLNEQRVGADQVHRILPTSSTTR